MAGDIGGSGTLSVLATSVSYNDGYFNIKITTRITLVSETLSSPLLKIRMLSLHISARHSFFFFFLKVSSLPKTNN